MMQVFQPGDEVLLSLPIVATGTGASFESFLVDRSDPSKRKLFDFGKFVLLSPVAAIYRGRLNPDDEDPEFVPSGYLEFMIEQPYAMIRVVEPGLGGFMRNNELVTDNRPISVGEVLEVHSLLERLLVRRMSGR